MSPNYSKQTPREVTFVQSCKGSNWIISLGEARPRRSKQQIPLTSMDGQQSTKNTEISSCHSMTKKTGKRAGLMSFDSASSLSRLPVDVGLVHDWLNTQPEFAGVGFC